MARLHGVRNSGRVRLVIVGHNKNRHLISDLKQMTRCSEVLRKGRSFGVPFSTHRQHRLHRFHLDAAYLSIMVMVKSTSQPQNSAQELHYAAFRLW